MDVFIALIVSWREVERDWGCSSNGRAIASHAIGNGIDARHLHSPQEDLFFVILYFISSKLSSPTSCVGFPFLPYYPSVLITYIYFSSFSLFILIISLVALHPSQIRHGVKSLPLAQRASFRSCNVLTSTIDIDVDEGSLLTWMAIHSEIKNRSHFYLIWQFVKCITLANYERIWFAMLNRQKIGFRNGTRALQH